MVPFVRTIGEAKEVIKLLSQNGLERGKNGLKMVMMCELPSNAILAEQFLELFDGFSIGSNDLTQLTPGLHRDSGLVAASFDERGAAGHAAPGPGRCWPGRSAPAASTASTSASAARGRRTTRTWRAG